jgi:hypothetical protein
MVVPIRIVRQVKPGCAESGWIGFERGLRGLKSRTEARTGPNGERIPLAGSPDLLCGTRSGGHAKHPERQCPQNGRHGSSSSEPSADAEALCVSLFPPRLCVEQLQLSLQLPLYLQVRLQFVM